MRPFYLDDIGTAFVYVLDTAGGMLTGDTLHYDIRVDDRARLYITNASTTKSYKMRKGDAQVRQNFSIGKYASLEYFPEEVMLFQETSMETVTQIEADPDGVFAFCEMYTSGRNHSGERFQFRSMMNRFDIIIGGKLAIWEQYRLDGRKLKSGQPGILESYTHWGNLYMYRKGNNTDLLRNVQEYLEDLNLNSIWAGCSLHPSGVLIVKALSSNYELLKECFHIVWSRLRPLMVKGELPYIRK